MHDTIATRPIAPFGIELFVDLRREMSPAEQAEFRRLFETHDLLLVRGNVLTMDEQLRVCELLGPVLHSDSGLMSNDTVIGLAGVELVFHSDYGYSPEPLQAISLHAVDVVDGETSTAFRQRPPRLRVAVAADATTSGRTVRVAGVRPKARSTQSPRRARSCVAQHRAPACTAPRSNRQSMVVRTRDDDRLDRRDARGRERSDHRRSLRRAVRGRPDSGAPLACR